MYKITDNNTIHLPDNWEEITESEADKRKKKRLKISSKEKNMYERKSKGYGL